MRREREEDKGGDAGADGAQEHVRQQARYIDSTSLASALTANVTGEAKRGRSRSLGSKPPPPPRLDRCLFRSLNSVRTGAWPGRPPRLPPPPLPASPAPACPPRRPATPTLRRRPAPRPPPGRLACGPAPLVLPSRAGSSPTRSQWGVCVRAAHLPSQGVRGRRVDEVDMARAWLT